MDNNLLQKNPTKGHAYRDAQRNAQIHDANAKRSILFCRNIGHIAKHAHQHGEPSALLWTQMPLEQYDIDVIC